MGHRRGLSQLWSSVLEAGVDCPVGALSKQQANLSTNFPDPLALAYVSHPQGGSRLGAQQQLTCPALFNPLRQSFPSSGLSSSPRLLFPPNSPNRLLFVCPVTLLLLKLNHFLPFLLQHNQHFLGCWENIKYLCFCSCL